MRGSQVSRKRLVALQGPLFKGSMDLGDLGFGSRSKVGGREVKARCWGPRNRKEEDQRAPPRQLC